MVERKADAMAEQTVGAMVGMWALRSVGWTVAWLADCWDADWVAKMAAQWVSWKVESLVVM